MIFATLNSDGQLGFRDSESDSVVQTFAFDGGVVQLRYGLDGTIETRSHAAGSWTDWSDATVNAGAGLTKTGDTISVDEGGVVTEMLADNAVTPAKSERLGYRTVTADTTLELGDVDGVVEVNSSSARTVTVPTDESVAFLGGTVIEVVRWGTGAVTISPASGVSLRSPDGEFGARTIASQYGSAFLRKRTANNWHLSGDLE